VLEFRFRSEIQALQFRIQVLQFRIQVL